MPISTIPEVLEDLRQGRMVILVDDPNRENEGDLAMLAEHVTPGISAADRARTIQVAADPEAQPLDLNRPGHVFPLRAREGGVLVRGGQTEGTVDLARLCGARPAGVICEIMNDDGTMARMPELEVFAEKHDLKICTIADLIAYRRRTERLIEAVELDLPMPTRFGEFRAHLFRNKIDGTEHFAVTRGLAEAQDDGPLDPTDEAVTVRMHSECLTGDVFHSERCDCGSQRDRALELIGQADRGVLVYLRQEGRGIGLANKLKAYRLQDGGMDTVEANQALGFPADLREYGIGAQILHFLGVRQMKLLTNNPKKIHGLAGYGLEVTDQVPLVVEPNPNNERYLRTKVEKLGHQIVPPAS